LQALYQKYGGEDFTILAVEVSGALEAGKKLLADNRYTFTALAGSWAMAKELFGVTGTPTDFLIDEQGRIIFKHVGYGTGHEETLEAELRELLERKASSSK